MKFNLEKEEKEGIAYVCFLKHSICLSSYIFNLKEEKKRVKYNFCILRVFRLNMEIDSNKTRKASSNGLRFRSSSYEQLKFTSPFHSPNRSINFCDHFSF